LAGITRESRRKTEQSGRGGGWWSRNEQRLLPYLFITPNLIVFIAFMFIPIVFALYVSLTQWTLIGASQFIGFDNYVKMLGEGQFWEALRNTAVYTLGVVPTSMVLGLAAAVLLNRKLPARTFLRSVYFMPVVISGVAVALIGEWMFNDQYGIINAVLGKLGIGAVNWLSSSTWAMVALIITTMWTRIGFCMVLYLASLQSIPETYYDAARVDGASGWARFRFITLPLLAPTTFLVLIIQVILSFRVFDLVYVMTGGGPGFSTTVLVQYIYEEAFTNQDMGYASAVGVVLYLILMVFTLIQWRISRQGEAGQ
jgi:multiple sugar transport system permease protein